MMVNLWIINVGPNGQLSLFFHANHYPKLDPLAHFTVFSSERILSDMLSCHILFTAWIGDQTLHFLSILTNIVFIIHDLTPGY